MAVSASEQKAKLSTPWEVKKVETKAEKEKKRSDNFLSHYLPIDIISQLQRVVETIF